MSIFSKVATPKLKSSNFNLSHEVKLSMNMGDLIPFLCQEVLPGDKFKLSTELLIKLAPLKAPVMHRITAYVHYFFVPTFQINSVFQDFINPKVNIDNSIVMPYFIPSSLKSYGQIGASGNTGGFIGSLCDYLGLPVTQSDWINASSGNSYQESVLIDPFRAYQHIYNCYFRDQNMEPDGSSSLFDVTKYLNIQGNAVTPIASGQQCQNLLRLRKRAWAKDYFTSALPSPQAGDDVLIPISSHVEANGAMRFTQLDSDGEYANTPPKGAAFWNAVTGLDTDNTLTGEDLSTPGQSDGVPVAYKSGLIAKNATATINDLRKAFALQRFKELAERGGTRYPEFVRNFFNAYLKDYWVDRPILLGGQKQPVKVGEVVQVSSNTSTDAMGERAGIGNSYGRTGGVYLNAPCHGYLLGILSIRPEATYQQGLDRMWTRKSIFDWAFPQFAQMGEQEVYQKELFVADTDSENNKVFGYTPRYAEYKTGHCHVCGEFRTSLAYWHFGRTFSNAPTLSKQFVMMDNVSTAPFNVLDSTTEHVYVDLYNNIHARRQLPYFGTPSIL